MTIVSFVNDIPVLSCSRLWELTRISETC